MWLTLSKNDVLSLCQPFLPLNKETQGKTNKFSGVIFFDVGSVLLDLDWESYEIALKALFEPHHQFSIEKFKELVLKEKLNSIWSSMYIFKWMCLLNSQLIKYLTYFISQLLFFFFFPSRMAPHCALSLSVMQLATSPPSAMATILILWPTPAHPRPLFSALSVETAPNSPSTSPNK